MAIAVVVKEKQDGLNAGTVALSRVGANLLAGVKDKIDG